VFEALKPGGFHFANYEASRVEGRDRFGCYFNYLSAENAIAAYSASAPWNILSIEDCEGGGYDGRRLPWIAVIAQRPTAMPQVRRDVPFRRIRS
jgi:hypothetical protein